MTLMTNDDCLPFFGNFLGVFDASTHVADTWQSHALILAVTTDYC